MHLKYRHLLSITLGLLLVLGLVAAIPATIMADGCGSSAEAVNKVVSVEGGCADGVAVALAENDSYAKASNYSFASCGGYAKGTALASAKYDACAQAYTAAEASGCSLALAKAEVNANCGGDACGTAIADATPGPCDQGTAISISSDFNKDALAIGYSFNITSGGNALSKSFVYSSAEDGACSDALAYSSSSGCQVAGDIAFGDGTSSAVTCADVSK